MKRIMMRMAALVLASAAMMPIVQPLRPNLTASAIQYYHYDNDEELDTSEYSYTQQADGTLSVYRMPIDQTVLEIPEEVDGMAVTDISIFALINTIAEDVYIPKTVTTIQSIAWSQASNLKNIVVDAENPVFSSVEGVLYNKSGDKIVVYPAGRTNSSFTIPEGVEVIGEGAFFRNPVLEQVTLASTTTKMNSLAFAQCPALEKINGMEQLVSIEKRVFTKSNKLLKTDGDFVMVDDWIVDLADMDTFNQKTEIVIPEYAGGFADFFFEGCKHMTTVTLSESLRRIPNFAFWECEGLTSVRIPESVKEIGACAFACCKELETLYLPADFDVSLISEIAFGDCPALKNVFIGDENTDWMPDTSSEGFEKHKIIASNTVATSIYVGPHSATDTIRSNGDVNQDGKLTIADVVLVQRWLLGENVELQNWQAADLNMDGTLNALDFSLMKSEFLNMKWIDYKIAQYFDSWE